MNCLLFRIVFQRFFRLKRNSCFCVWDFLLLLACVFVQFLYRSCTESERYLQTPDFRLRTSHFEVQTSDFGIVISGFSPSLVLAFSHQAEDTSCFPQIPVPVSVYLSEFWTLLPFFLSRIFQKLVATSMFHF